MNISGLRLKDREGIIIHDPFDEYEIIIGSRGIITHFMIRGENDRNYFAVVELIEEGLFIIHDTLKSDKIYLIKDSKMTLKDIFRDLMTQIEKELSTITDNDIHFIDSMVFRKFLVFGSINGKFNNMNGKTLSSITIYNETIPIEIIKNGKITGVLIYADDFINIFFEVLYKNYELH